MHASGTRSGVKFVKSIIMVKERRKSLSSGSRTVDIWAVQCDKCYKWRKIHSQEEFEEIRSKCLEDPFFCGKKPNLTCDNPTDIEHDSSRVWVADKPNIPKTPPGFKRRLVMRKDYTRMDIYYTTPTGKTLRSSTEAASFLQDNPEFKDLSPSDFCFTRPKIIGDSTKNTRDQIEDSTKNTQDRG